MPVNNPALAPTIAPKSVQRGQGLIANNSSTANITITAVNTAKAEVRVLGAVCVAGTLNDNLPRLALTSSTNVQAVRVGTSGACDFNWEVTEWN